MSGVMAVALLAAAWMDAPSAQARHTEQYAYSYQQLWRAAIRLVAVDHRFDVSDQDRESGYFLFTYRQGTHEYPASVEFVPVETPGYRTRTRVTFQVQGMPSYVERMMQDRLNRKLRDDFGSPPRARLPQPSAPEDDDDEDAAGDDEDDASDS